MGYL
ncbi:hypothetical protein Taro_049999 [Colocasia esculenta]|jgi:hypothetical protein